MSELPKKISNVKTEYCGEDLHLSPYIFSFLAH